ncbi:MAG TPA: UDP-N-acetylmuramoyl-L-alanine--D-glutamate ligase [Gammaproteobacteria bacterium]|nr:UDP-N-acetylmuramoyl-L-alanine--D-glutamate ligase [Gammaproteobacteria bacterium]
MATKPAFDLTAEVPRRPYLIMGMGKTGCSVATWFAQSGVAFDMADSRAELRNASQLQRTFPASRLYLADELNSLDCRDYQSLVLSPGVPHDIDLVQFAERSGIPVIGDIEVFFNRVRSPVTAVTGSNGKSTVVDLLTQMHRCAGQCVGLGGNFGTPALDLIGTSEPERYVLELSSFQLETTQSLHCDIATVLNLSEDHMDRYRDFNGYAKAKGKIYRNASWSVVNRDDRLASQLAEGSRRMISFGLDVPEGNHFGVRKVGAVNFLCHGRDNLLPVSELKLLGRHNWANALAALAMGYAAGLPRSAMLQALRDYPGLDHRIQWVAEQKGVTWLNDSKATNPGAAVAALKGLNRPVILIAGGESKGADFSVLGAALEGVVKQVILLGREAENIAMAMSAQIPVTRVADMREAVDKAGAVAESGDYVLLAPACASFDMFKNYAHRGDVFMELVRAREPGK